MQEIVILIIGASLGGLAVAPVYERPMFERTKAAVQESNEAALAFSKLRSKQ